MTSTLGNHLRRQSAATVELFIGTEQVAHGAGSGQQSVDAEGRILRLGMARDGQVRSEQVEPLAFEAPHALGHRSLAVAILDGGSGEEQPPVNTSSRWYVSQASSSATSRSPPGAAPQAGEVTTASRKMRRAAATAATWMFSREPKTVRIPDLLTPVAAAAHRQ